MKRRREIGPKIQKNFGSLTKFLLLALAVAIVGGSATVVLYKLIGPRPVDEDIKKVHLIPPFILALTIISVLALIFFGVRSYLSGKKVRVTLQRSRMKVKR